MGKADPDDPQEAACPQCPLPPLPPQQAPQEARSVTEEALRAWVRYSANVQSLRMVTGVPRKVWVDQSPQAGPQHQPLSFPRQVQSRGVAKRSMPGMKPRMEEGLLRRRGRAEPSFPEGKGRGGGSPKHPGPCLGCLSHSTGIQATAAGSLSPLSLHLLEELSSEEPREQACRVPDAQPWLLLVKASTL